MRAAFSEPSRTEASCEIRGGTSSWSDDSNSIKFTWFDKTGKACRGGEVPVEALPQMLEFAIRHGLLKVGAI
jgi:hypothetical protein